MDKVKNYFKSLFAGDARVLLFTAIAFMLPAFIYSLFGSLFFGIAVTGFADIPLWINLMMIPSGLILAFFFFYFICYGAIYGWIIKPLIKLFKKK
jgi:hypothetical protein